MNLIDGKKVAADIRNELKEKVSKLKAEGKNIPGLVAIIVGDDPASHIYVSSKGKACEEIGMRTKTEKLPADPNNYDYSSLGFGFLLRAAGNTAIAKDVYAHIAADIRYDSLGEPDSNASANKVESVNFSSLSFGVRLGISYQF